MVESGTSAFKTGSRLLAADNEMSSFNDTNNPDDEILKCITLHRRVKLSYLRPLHSNDSLLPNKHMFLFELRYKSLYIRDEYLSTTK